MDGYWMLDDALLFLTQFLMFLQLAYLIEIVKKYIIY